MAAGTAVGGPVGMVIGAIVGKTVSKASYLCDATRTHVGLSQDQRAALSRFRLYAIQNHREPLMFYLKHGPALIAAISEQEEDISGFYLNLKENFIIPVFILSDSSHQEEAYQVYVKTTSELIKKYLPDVYDEGMKIIENDQQRFEEAA